MANISALSVPIEEPRHWRTMGPNVQCMLVTLPIGGQEFDDVEKNIKKMDRNTVKEILKVG